MSPHLALHNLFPLQFGIFICATVHHALPRALISRDNFHMNFVDENRDLLRHESDNEA